MVSPSSDYDVLALLHYTRETGIQGLAAPELHMFGYIAQLIGRYFPDPMPEWGYSFASTPSGAPFSEALEVSLSYALETGLIERQGRVLHLLSSRGIGELQTLEALLLDSRRSLCLEAVVSLLLFFTPGEIRRALSFEPELNASTYAGRSIMLQPQQNEIVKIEMANLRTELNAKTTELLLPTISWVRQLLSYAYSSSAIGA